jgi:Skp family chaperone for outer membrane proteins
MYPFYELDPKTKPRAYELATEVSDEFYAKYKKVMTEFTKLQKELAKMEKKLLAERWRQQ